LRQDYEDTSPSDILRHQFSAIKVNLEIRTESPRARESNQGGVAKSALFSTFKLS